MRRYASIDFLRGLAIFMMLILHQVADTLDINNLLDNLDAIPLANVVLLVVLPFLGGLAGFFLLVSATGNAVSMTKFLMKGKSAGALAIRQFLGGFLRL